MNARRPIMLRTALMMLLVTAALCASASAQPPSPKQQAADMAGQLMSPFCPGRLLADCTSPNAGELRQAIAARIAAGETADAVKADLVRRYGTAILGAPQPKASGCWRGWCLASWGWRRSAPWHGRWRGPPGPARAPRWRQPATLTLGCCRNSTTSCSTSI